MKTTVVCGLLGSGKTTFIKNYLKERREKTVVLVNDFGAAGIDGEIFSAGGIESIELPSGCVCCSLRFDLITTITKIVKEFAPERLVIEPSGVASPSAVLEAIVSAGVENVSVVGIVDAAEFTEIQDAGIYGSFFEDQLKNSDIILVNKTDLAEEEKIIETVRRIEAVNPRAIVLRSVNAEVQADSLPLTATDRPAPERLNRRNRLRVIGSGQDDHVRFEALSCRLNSGTKLTCLSSFFRDLARGRYGSVVRAKGLIQTEEGPYRFDVVFGRVDTVCFDRDIKESRLVVIGEALNKPAIEKALLEGCSEEPEERRVDGRDSCR
ncbi:MAG TPA: GTP-binding protein [Nitrospirota bacterium]|nr:GTP-binding protein [Nitrospirota bacterium]